MKLPLVRVSDAVLPGETRAIPMTARLEKLSAEHVVAAKPGAQVAVLAARREPFFTRRAGWFFQVQALSRVLILRRVRSGGVRLVEVEILPPGQAAGDQLDKLARKVRSLARRLTPPSERTAWRNALREADPDRLVDRVGSLASCSSEIEDARSRILETPDLEERIALVQELVETAAATLENRRKEALAFERRRRERVAHRRSCNVNDLLIWKKYLRGAGGSPISHSASRTNPVVVGDLLLVCTWSPGAVFALDVRSGLIRWRKKLSVFPREVSVTEGGLLLVATTHTVHALDVASGKGLWSFCPYDTRGEWIYSTPVEFEGQVYFGDRKGFFWSLDLQSGHPLWSVQPHPTKAQLNASPLPIEGLILTASNGSELIAVTPHGDTAWLASIAGPCSAEVLAHRGGCAVAPAREAVSIHRAVDGLTLHRWGFPNRQIRSCAVMADSLLILTDELDDPKRPTGRTERELTAVRADQVVWQQRAAEFAWCYHWDAGTNLVYEARVDGMAILDPSSGERLFDFYPGDLVSRTPSPCVHENVIYVLNHDGYVLALSHPE